MKIDRLNGIPLYLQAKWELEKAILDGKYKIGDKIPSERDLSKITGINRLMVRKALIQLLNDGVLKVKKNIGYFVKDISPLLEKKIKQKNGLIGFIVPFLINKYFFSFFEGINLRLYEENLLAIIGDSRGDPDLEKELIINFIKKGIDGLILFPYKDIIDSDYIKYLESLKVPYVLTHCNDNIKTTCINIDNFNGGKEVTEYLIKYGHKNIAFLTEMQIEEWWYIKERFNGYKAALKENKLKFNPDYIYQKINMEDEAQLNTIINDMFSKKITSIFCVTDREAHYLFQACKKKDIRIPDDISIIGFNNIRFANDPECQFTSMAIDSRTIGTELVDILLKKLYNSSPGIIKKKFSTHIIEKGSVKKINSRGA